MNYFSYFKVSAVPPGNFELPKRDIPVDKDLEGKVNTQIKRLTSLKNTYDATCGLSITPTAIKNSFLTKINSEYNEIEIIENRAALLKRSIDLFDSYIDHQPLPARIHFLILRLCNSGAGKEYNELVDKYHKSYEVSDKQKVKALISVYKRIDILQEMGKISDENKAKLLKSCEGIPCEVEDLYYPEKNGTYTGEILNGVPHGSGEFICDKNEVYEGSWDKSIMVGEGTFQEVDP